MKKALLCTLTLLLAVAAVHAQSVLAEKDIIGKWKMTAFHMSGIYYDFGKDSLALSDELKSQMGGGSESEVIAEFKRQLQPYTEGSVEIGNDHSYSQTLMGESADGVYKLISKEGIQYLSIVNNNANKDVDELKVKKLNGRLVLSLPAEGGGETILFFNRM